MMKMLIGLCLVVLFYAQARAASAESIGQQNLTCTAIPSNKYQLCYQTNESTLGPPYTDVRIYRKAPGKEMLLLREDMGSVSSFAGFGFSEGGRYMWLEWADEGHPYLNFYLTSDFVGKGIKAKILETLDEYGLASIIYFSRGGAFIYTIDEYADRDCPKSTCVHTLQLNKQPKPNAVFKWGKLR